MSTEAQRVVVIQDASREFSPGAIASVFEGLSLEPGDKLTVVGVLHQVNNPMGYKIKVDSTSMFSANNKIIAEEVARKQEEYINNPEIMEISKHCETKEIQFDLEILAGPLSKMVALKAARNLKATWVILDRYMKKDKKFFMEKLYCGISRMKRNNSLEQLRGPKVRKENKHEHPIRAIPSRDRDQVTYDEMIPGSPPKVETPSKSISPPRTTSVKGKIGDDYGELPWNSKKKISPFSKSSSNEQLISMTTLSSPVNIEASSFMETNCSPFSQEEQNTINTERETAGEQSPFVVDHYNQEELCTATQEQKQQSVYNDWTGGSPKDEVIQNSICTMCKNRRPKIGWKRDFTYAELQAATQGFSETNFLSEGGFGSVYKGEVNGMKIAVKQHKNVSLQGEKEFKSEVHVLSKARHENLVMLLGSCSEGKHRLLVYEYVCNGSLDQHLSKHTRRPLSWEKRMKIALGAARGLRYLHENSIIHRDMRPNNILVTHDYETLLGDFGLARTQHGDPDHSSETRVVGTLGYLAPEYAECGKVSTKTDVYSFGVVLLQLITGLKTTDKLLGGKSLVGWARPLLKERNYPDLIDPRILDSHDVHQLFWMVRVAEKCLSKDPQKRLSMDKVVYALSYIMEGDTMRGIRDFSPAKSDSVSSIPDSNDSQGEVDNEETGSLYTSNPMTAPLPPSPSIQVISTRKPWLSAHHGRSYR